MKFILMIPVVIVLGICLIFVGILRDIPEHKWVCPDAVTEQHRAFVIACAMHSGQGVVGCTNDADQLFCLKQEVTE